MKTQSPPANRKGLAFGDFVATTTLLSLTPVEQSLAQLVINAYPSQDNNNQTVWIFSGSSTSRSSSAQIRNSSLPPTTTTKTLGRLTTTATAATFTTPTIPAARRSPFLPCLPAPIPQTETRCCPEFPEAARPTSPLPPARRTRPPSPSAAAAEPSPTFG